MTDDEQILRPKKAQKILGLGETAFKDLAAAAGFVKVRISKRAAGFLRSEIQQHIAACVASAKAEAQKAPAKPPGRYRRRTASGAAA